MDIVLFFIGIIAIISSIAVKLSKRFGIPILLIYIGLGVLIGSNGLLHFEFNNYELTEHIGIFALCYILFTGALEMNFKHVKSVLWEGVSLSSAGVFLTTFMIGLGTYFISSFTIIECLLIGAIISSTDAAAVISIFHFSSSKVPKKLENVLKLESGSNDPTAITLVIFFIALIQKQQEPNVITAMVFLIVEIGIGFIAGIIFGKIGEIVLNRLSVGIFELNHILILGLVLATYSATKLIQGNGFLAVYILGLYMSRSKIAYKNSTIRFYSTFSWIMQIIMFILLGLLVTPSNIVFIWKEALIISLILVFIARPVTVFLCLAFFKEYKLKDKLFVAWGGLKGAVPIIFATYPVVAGVPNGIIIFHIIFFVVIISVLLQGTTLDLLASKLNFQEHSIGASINTTVDLDKLEYIENSLVQIMITPHSNLIGLQIKELNLPNNVLIMSIKRNNSYVSPKGDTVLLIEDLLFIMTPDRSKFIKGYLAEKQLREHNKLVRVIVSKNSSFLKMKVGQMTLPYQAKIVSIQRKETFLTPQDDTLLLQNDLLFIKAKEIEPFIEEYLNKYNENIQTIRKIEDKTVLAL